MPDRRPAARARLGLTALIGALIVLPASAFAQSAGSGPAGPMEPARYAAEIRSLATSLREADAGSLAAVQPRVPAVWTVRVGERTVDVPGVWLQQRLRDGQRAPELWPTIRSQLLEGLSIAEQEALSLGGEPAAEIARARLALDEVLARPEFAQMARETAMTRLQQRLVDWLRRWWARIGGDRLPVRSTASVFAWIASLAALAVLAGWLVQTLRRTQRLPRMLADVPEGRRVPARVWAQRAVSADDVREAVRCAYRAVVSRYEEDGTWRIDEARTPREYVRLLPRDHAGRPILEDVARRFEEVWFGGRSATLDDRGSLVRQLKELGCLPAD